MDGFTSIYSLDNWKIAVGNKQERNLIGLRLKNFFSDFDLEEEKKSSAGIFQKKKFSEIIKLPNFLFLTAIKI